MRMLLPSIALHYSYPFLFLFLSSQGSLIATIYHLKLAISARLHSKYSHLAGCEMN